MALVNHRSRLARFLLMFVVAFLAFWVLGSDAYAQNYHAQQRGFAGRKFPDAAYRGDFKLLDYPYVMLDGKKERLAPGTRIIDTKNRIIRPRSIAGKRQPVNYVRFRNGSLHTIWLLTPKEIQEKRKSANPKWWEKLYDGLEGWIDFAKWYGLSQLGL